jgi:hypothetical protein
MASLPLADPPTPTVASMPPTSTPLPTTTGRGKSQRKHEYHKRLRQTKRLSSVKGMALKRANEATAIQSDISREKASSVRVSTTAWTGVRCSPPEAREYSLRELRGKKFQFELVDWDGISPIVFLDKEGRAIVVLAGCPRLDWDNVVNGAADVLREAHPRCNFPPSEHRRGKFAALATGISFGGGQKVKM